MVISVDPALRLSLVNDFVFKAVLTSSEEVLISLLTAVLKPHAPIQQARVLNPELPKDFADEKGGFLDVAVELADGTRLDVEMQAHSAVAFSARALFYWARLFSGQLVAGQDHGRLARTISLLFLGYREYPFSRAHEVFRIAGEHTGTRFSSLLEVHTIELPKVGKVHEALSASERPFVRWCRYLASKDAREIQQLTSEDPMIEKAEEKVAKISMDPHQREAALERERRQIAAQLIMTAARDEGLAVGIAEGRLEGRVEGRLEGRVEGRLEGFRQALELQLEAAFGPLAEPVRQRLARADEAELARWMTRLRDAHGVDEVFAEGSAPA